MTVSSPIVVSGSIVTFEKIFTLLPTTALSPMTLNGPIPTFDPTFAVFDTEASGDTPEGIGRSANQRATTRAIAKYGLPTLIRCGPAATSLPTRTAAARVVSSCGAYFGFDRKLICRSVASESGATP